MRRVLAFVIIAFGLVFIAPPAEAAVSVTITASPTTLVEGGSTVIKGKAVNAKPGSVVRLQHWASGSWQTVASRKVWSTQTYSFSRKPAPGHPRFRVFKPAQLGQAAAVSTVVTLTVKWLPRIQVSTTQLPGNGIRQTVTVSNNPFGGTIEPQWRNSSADTWKTGEAPPYGASSFTREYYDDPGTQYRYVVWPTSMSATAISTVATIARVPYHLALNSGVDLTQVPQGDDAATVLFDATAGARLTLVGSSGEPWSAEVFAPGGQSMGSFPDTFQPLRFVAPATGEYEISVSSNFGVDHATIWGSTPKHVPATMDGDAVAVVNDVPGQIVDVTFDAAAGQAFTVTTNLSGPTEEQLLAPGGEVREAWLPDVAEYGVVKVFRAAVAGTYRYEYIQNQLIDQTATVLSAPLLDSPLGQVTTAEVDRPSRVVLIPFDVPAGEHVAVGGSREGTEATIATFDATTGLPVTYTDGGSYVVAVSAPYGKTGLAKVQLAPPLTLNVTPDGTSYDVDNSDYMFRYVDLTFSGDAGDLIYFTAGGASGGGGRAPRLFAADGTLVPLLGWGKPSWHLPSSGTYVLSAGIGQGNGSFAIDRADEVPLASDGTPSVVTIDQPGEVVFVPVSVASGTPFDVTLDQIDASLGDNWNVDVFAPDGYWYNSFAKAGTLPTFIVRDPGDVYILVSADNDATGSLRLSAKPFTP